MSISREMDKDGDIYIMKYHSAIKKKEIVSFAAKCMNLGIIILSKSEKEKYHIISLMLGS